MSEPDGAPRPNPRVLHVIPSLAIGGTETQLVRFIERSSAPERHHVAVFDEPGPLAERIPHPPIELGHLSYERTPSAAASSAHVVFRLRNTVRTGGFQLVHAHLGIAEAIAALATRRSVPLVASRRGRNVGFEANAAYKLVEGLGHRRVDVLICNARYWAELAEREDRWPPRTRVIHNAVDLGEFPEAPMPPDPPSVVVVANLHAAKRLDVFLRAFERLRAELPEARATIAGDGPERGRLEALTSRLGLSGAVTFAGRVADPQPLLAAAHVTALTSEHEGFPNALLEAMATGRPVVATGVGGVPELVRDRVDGFLTSRDPDEVARRLLDLLADADLRGTMGRAARERAGEFGWERLVEETEAVYGEVLEARRT